MGFLVFFILLGIFYTPIRHKVILTENYIQIKIYRILFCFNSEKAYDYTNINFFQVEIEDMKNGKVKYLDIYNKKYELFDHFFELEEAEYFVYVVNGFISRKKNMVELSKI